MKLINSLHHGYIGSIIMMIGLWSEIQTWDDNGQFRNLFPFQDVFSWIIAFAGLGLFMSDLLEHFITREKHTDELNDKK